MMPAFPPSPLKLSGRTMPLCGLRRCRVIANCTASLITKVKQCAFSLKVDRVQQFVTFADKRRAICDEKYFDFRLFASCLAYVQAFRRNCGTVGSCAAPVYPTSVLRKPRISSLENHSAQHRCERRVPRISNFLLFLPVLFFPLTKVPF
jgi:hypothetical protein